MGVVTSRGGGWPDHSGYDTVVCRATARDADRGVNGALRYAFTAETRRQHGGTFDIRPDTGDVVVVGELDYETRRDYALYVTATDRAERGGGGGSGGGGGGGRSDSGALTGMISINVRVEDVNDHAPDIAFHVQPQSSSLDHHHHQQQQLPQSSSIHQRHAVRARPLPAVTVDRGARVGSFVAHVTLVCLVYPRRRKSAVPGIGACCRQMHAFVAHVTVRDSDDGANGRFRCALRPPPPPSDDTDGRNASDGDRFALRQIYDTEYMIVTTAPLTAIGEAAITVYCADRRTLDV